MPVGVLSDKQVRYLNWLCTPPEFRAEDERTQLAWTNKEGVSSSLPGQWKRENKTFRRAMKERFKELNTDPHRVQEVVDAMQAAAAAGDVKAGIFYLQFVGEYLPAEKRIVETNTTRSLSNEELLAELKSEADRLESEIIMEHS